MFLVLYVAEKKFFECYFKTKIMGKDKHIISEGDGFILKNDCNRR